MEKINCLRCNFRHTDNGNCTAVGGFCTAVPAAHCPLLREYLDTGIEPEAVETVKLALAAKHMVDLETLNNTPISRLVELAEADKDGRVSVLPCKPRADMINKILPGSTYLMERVHFAVAYVNKGNIYLMTQRTFEGGVKNGTIVSAATERAMEGRKDG